MGGGERRGVEGRAERGGLGSSKGSEKYLSLGDTHSGGVATTIMVPPEGRAQTGWAAVQQSRAQLG